MWIRALLERVQDTIESKKEFVQRVKEYLRVTPKIQEPMEEQAPEEPESDSPVIRIFQKIIRWIKYIVQIAFFPVIAALLASFVANEMIIYPAPIRLGFFLFTFLLCYTMRHILILLGIFYICKWGFHYYVNEMSDGPKRLIMPTTFAFLPLTTRQYQSRFMNTIMSPFQYGEGFSKKDGEELQQRMEGYKEALDEAFPYLQAIKTQEPFETRHRKIEAQIAALHLPPPPPPLPIQPAPLPAVIASAPNAPSLPPSGPLPPVISPS